MRVSRVCAVVLCAAGISACGQVQGASQPAAPHPGPPGTHTGRAGTADAVPPGAGSARAGTGSAAPAVTVQVSGPVAGVHSAQPAPPRLTGSVTLTAADVGAVVSLRVGEMVTVVLAPDFEAWHQPTAGGGALRRVSASGGYPGRAPARAAFLAVAPGAATLTDISDTACLHASPPCMVPQRTWQVTVTVRGS